MLYNLEISEFEFLELFRRCSKLFDCECDDCRIDSHCGDTHYFDFVYFQSIFVYANKHVNKMV